MSVFNSGYYEAFAAARRVPQPVLNYYLWLLLGSQRHRMLDVGAGTGQFAEVARHEWATDVTLLESSPSAAEVLRRTFPSESVIECGFEDFESTSRFPAVLLSEVVHLLDFNPRDLLIKLRSVLEPGGAALIRTSSKHQLEDRQWYRHFPAALQLDVERHLNIEILEECCVAERVQARRVVVDESRWVSAADYASWFRSLAFSTLRLIPEGEYRQGMMSLEKSLSGSPAVWHDYQMTALILEF